MLSEILYAVTEVSWLGCINYLQLSSPGAGDGMKRENIMNSEKGPQLQTSLMHFTDQKFKLFLTENQNNFTIGDIVISMESDYLVVDDAK